MQVDSTFQQQLPISGPSFDDFFNMELASSSSRSSSSRSPSPRSPIPTLPPPPPYSNPQIASQEPVDSFFNFFVEDDLKDIPFSPNLSAFSTGPAYDFLASLPSSTSSDSGSPMSSLNSAASPPFLSDPSQLFAIDPQLVGTPTTSKSVSDFDLGEVEEEEAEEEEEGEEIIRPVKVAGRGKLRKGTVQSGGISKSSVSSSASRNKENAVISQVVRRPSVDGKVNEEDDDWRPTPEEYKKMSSKEKRQLRNKISARNFRVRRKEYISTLENDLSERDRLLDAVRSELDSKQLENIALRQEIAALKRTLLAGRGVEDIPVLPPPAPLPTASPTPVPVATSPLPTPNTQKDVGAKKQAFWGGVGMGMGMGGITPVHTAIIPELNVGLGLSNKPLTENLNPALNIQRTPDEYKLKMASFEGFMERDMFTLKSLDAYRMQLWGKMAAQHNAHQQFLKQTTSPAPLNGLASNMRPHFFHGQGVGLSGSLSGKAFGPSKDVPLANRNINVPISSGVGKPTQEQAMLAAMASQTLLGKLRSAFWDAFSGSGASSPSSLGSPHYFSGASNTGIKSQVWDADKVRKVLEGSAVVKVVDVEPVKVESVPASPKAVTSSLSSSCAPKWVPCCPREREASVSERVTEKTSAVTPVQQQQQQRCEWEKCVHDILEENFRSLSLGKKA